jgi:coenzyme F420 hydrogenase subunit beta
LARDEPSGAGSMKQSAKLSFDDLQRDVVDQGLCNRCGACVSFCTAHQIGAIEMCPRIGNQPHYADPERCFRCGICYLICPQTQELNEDVREKFGWAAPVGAVRDVVSARTTDPEIAAAATDGGVVTALLAYMLESGAIDGAIAAKRTGLFNREPTIAVTRAELVEAAGSQFSETPSLGEVGEKYSTYVPVLPVVRMFGPKRTAKLAVVGTPCQTTAIRKMQVLNILPSDTIHFTIGLFCMQCFAFEDLMDKGFVRKYRIRPGDIRKVNVKDDFRLELKSGVTIRVPFREVEDIARPACLACRDFANDFADVSVGGLGSPDGYTTTVIRTTLAARLFAEAVDRGYIEVAARSDGEKRATLSLIEAVAARKVARAANWKARFAWRPQRRESSRVAREQFAGVSEEDDLCSECEKLNRHLTWVVRFVSHELSSALGNVVMNISALADPDVAGRLSSDRRERMLLNALSSLKLMQDMVKNYLASSKVRTGRLEFDPSVADVGDIVGEVAARLRPSLQMKGMSFACERRSECKVVCDERLVRVAINNLVQNAIKYGTENTTIRATLEKWNDGFELSITNEGIGIPEDQFEAVFDEYTRFGTGGVGGTGLGLFLVKKIAEMHGGRVEVDAGRIIDDRFVTHRMIRENPGQYPAGRGEERKFAVLTLRIPNCALAGSGPARTKGEGNG